MARAHLLKMVMPLLFGMLLQHVIDMWLLIISEANLSSPRTRLSSLLRSNTHDTSQRMESKENTLEQNLQLWEGPRIASEVHPDEEFVNSKEFIEIEKDLHSRFDVDLLIESFDRDGYIIWKPDIPEEDLRDAQEFTQQVYDTCVKKTGTAGCNDMHQDRFTDQRGVKALAQNKDINNMLGLLHKHRSYPFQTLNYPMTSFARTHSDYVHFASHPLPLMAAAWVALMDISKDAGPVFYYPGSHKMDAFNMQDLGLDPRQHHKLNYAKYQDIMGAFMENRFERQEAVMERGWCLIWSANLVHGGPPPKNEGALRLSQVTHYFFRNSNYNWAPVASDVNKDSIEYYDEAAVDYKWGDRDTPELRRAASKFKGGTCDTFTAKKPGVPSPCHFKHRIPQVLSRLLEHRGEEGNDVIM